MIATAIISLTLVAVAQVIAHPPFYTLNDADSKIHPSVPTLNDENGGFEVLSVIEPFEKTIPERVAGGQLYQSDMLLTEQQWEAVRSRKAIDNEKMRWTEGPDGYPLIPYTFLDSVNRDAVQAGLDHWMEHTCINFEHTTNTDRPHLQFFMGKGCWSAVGMNYWKRKGNYGQLVSLGKQCNKLSTVVHELGHAMGFFHEQSRADRDDHVTVVWENVIEGTEQSFEKKEDNNFGIKYDYSSIMHYGMNFCTKNGLPTIVTNDPLAQEIIGIRKGERGLSHRDKLLANTMYKCLGKWLDKCGISSDPCQNEGYIGKDCTCVCPPHTSGSNCENIVANYYAAFRNPQTEKIISEKSITVVTDGMGKGDKYVKWIVPPKCNKVKLTITSARFEDCKDQYFIVRTDSANPAGQKMCKEDFSVGSTLESDWGISMIMINRINYGDYKSTMWSADVTFENIPGCSDVTTVEPTEPPTDPSAPLVECTKEAKLQVLQQGEAITIASPDYPSEYTEASCAWKIKAANKKSMVSISCEDFSLYDEDKLVVNRKTFTKDSAISAKKLLITFKSKEWTSGPGFRCTVVAN